MTLIDQLKENKPIKPILDDLIDEDSSSNSRTSGKEENKTIDKTVKPAQTEEYSIKESTDEFSLKQTITINKKKTEVPVEEEDAEEEQSDEEMEDEEEEEEPEEIPEPVVHKKKKHKSS